MDFALRQSLDFAIKNKEEELGSGQSADLAIQMLMIESMAHRGAANPVSTEGIRLLINAVKLLGSLNNTTKYPFHEQVLKREKRCMTQVNEYNARLSDLPSSLVALAFGFKPISTDSDL